jgi:hypothetical protein
VSEIGILNELIGSHKSMPFISDELLKAVDNKLKSKYTFFRGIYSPYNNLERIALIEYKANIDPFTLSKKLHGLDFIEYVEPLPLKRLVAVPNDSLIYQQYYLSQIKIYDAWDNIEPDSSIFIGIVDTGIDYEHEDMKDKIWTNPGETGLDNKGNDKSSNGIDDDNNGYIDDWRGWDFVSSTSSKGDNDPMPGHAHGTHVAGIAAATTGNVRGIAGIARAAKLLPVKVASDNPFSTSVSNSYQGVLYAATMGADIINCSWGSSSRSEAEMEIIAMAASLGSVIVTAAGNDGDEIAFFPGSYDDVISVSAVGWNDKRASFSNFHHTVDIAAPGVDIFSSVPGNEYYRMDGTSMASPVIAGVAALVKGQFPDYTPVQIREHLKASSDNIDSLNPYFIGKIGRGRVNALKAVSSEIRKSVILSSYNLKDENNNNILEKDEIIELWIDLTNVLAPLENANVEINFITSYKPQVFNKSIYFGAMKSLQTLKGSSALSFKLPSNVPTDFSLLIEILIFDGKEYINSEFVSANFNPSYRTMDANNIAVTFNSRGNIAFNDYPANFQGDGFKYKGSSNLLYEGALMLGLPPGIVSNVARGANQMGQDEHFFSNDPFLKYKGEIATEEGSSIFYTYASDLTLSAEVKQKVYQFQDGENDDLIIVVYDIINTSDIDYDSLFVALYFDWDIGPSGANNIAKFESNEGFGYVKNLAIDTLPIVAVNMLSNHKLNFFAIDNDSEALGNPGVWDGFYRDEKWMTMSSGIYRKESSITDVSMVTGAGPINVKSKDTTRVAFTFFSAYNMDILKFINRLSRITAEKYDIANGKYNPLPKSDSIAIIYPNPSTSNKINVNFALSDGSYVSIDIFNVLGQKVYSAVKNKLITAGNQSEVIDLPKLPQGRYYLRLSTTNTRLIEPFEIGFE